MKMSLWLVVSLIAVSCRSAAEYIISYQENFLWRLIYEGSEFQTEGSATENTLLASFCIGPGHNEVAT